MKSIIDYINEADNQVVFDNKRRPIFNEESRVKMLGGSKGVTVFSVEDWPILDYAQYDEKAITKLIKSAKRNDKIYVLSFNKVFGHWETVITFYYTNKYGKADDEIMGSSNSNYSGITEKKIKKWAESGAYKYVVVKVA